MNEVSWKWLRKPMRMLGVASIIAVSLLGSTGALVDAGGRRLTEPPITAKISGTNRSSDISSVLLGSLSLSVRFGASSCPNGWLCFFEHRDFRGRMVQFRDSGLQNLGSYGFNDQMSSWINRTNRDARWYKHAHGQGASYCMPAGSIVSRVGGHDDEASSFRIYSASGVCR